MKTLLGDLRLRTDIPPYAPMFSDGKSWRLSLVLTPPANAIAGYEGIRYYSYETDMVWRWRKLPSNKTFGRYLDFAYWKKLPVEVPTIPAEARHFFERFAQTHGINVYLEPREEVVDANNGYCCRWINIHLQFVPPIENLSGYLGSLVRQIDSGVQEFCGGMP